MILSGFHPVLEAVRTRARDIEWVLLDSARRDRRTHEIKEACRAARVPVRYGDRKLLDRTAGPRHQGVAARMAVRSYLPEPEATAGERGSRLLFVLDGVQDPHNLGAILRVAEAVGARVLLPERGSAPLSETVSRSSAGAVERVPVVRAGNIRRAIDRLKEDGFQVVGLDSEGTDLYALDLTGDLALVLGGEGKGIRRLVREGCDRLARLPMKGTLGSLNVSAAAAAAGYEALRQRARVGKGLA